MIYFSGSYQQDKWGRDWDLIFPVSQLHQGYVEQAVY
jgi:hypothetical protein